LENLVFQRRHPPFSKSACALFPYHPFLYFHSPPASDRRLRMFYFCLTKRLAGRTARDDTACFFEGCCYKQRPEPAIPRRSSSACCEAICRCLKHCLYLFCEVICRCRKQKPQDVKKRTQGMKRKGKSLADIMRINGMGKEAFLCQFI